MNKVKKFDWIENHFLSLSFAIAASALLLYIGLDPQYRTGYLNDDALYVIRARELAHNFPFRSLLVRPDYPMPGLPLLLAPLVRFTDGHWTSLERLSILATLVSVFLLWKWTSKWLSKGEALAITALYAFNPLTARFSGIIMPAAYFALAAIATFILLSDLLEKPTRQKALGLGFIVGWASLLRPESVLLLVSILPALWVNRKGRRMIPFMAIPIVLWLLFFIVTIHSRAALQTEYGGDLSALRNFWSQSLMSGLSFVGDMLRSFLVSAMLGISRPRTWVGMTITPVLIICCFVFIGMGLRRLWKEHASQRSLFIAMGLYCVLYFGMHVFWHVTAQRYAIPILPFLILFFVHGGNSLFDRTKKKTVWAAAVFAFLLVPYIYRNAQAVHEALLAPDPMKSPPWESLTWLNQNTSSDVQVLSDIATNVELYTDRQAVIDVPAVNSEAFLYRLNKDNLGYIVYRQLFFVTPGVGAAVNPNLSWSRMSYWSIQNPERFPIVFSNTAEQTVIFKVVPEKGFTEAYETTKAALRDYLAGRLHNALRLALQSTEMDSKLALNANLLGAIYLRQNDPLNAERAWLHTIVLMPDCINAMVNLATYYQLIGQPDRAAPFLQKAKEIVNREGQAELFDSNMAMRQKEWEQHRAMLFIDPLE